MIIISFANQKGGVGKTTSAVTIGHALAMQGQRVLIVDTDPQGHVAMSLGNDKWPGFYNLIVEEQPVDEVAELARPNLWIVPGDKRTEKAQRYLVGMDYRETAIAAALRECHYDVVLIDMAPSLGVIHVASLVASDWMIIPTRLDHLAIDGVNEVLRTYAQIVRQGSNLQGFSILPTFLDRTTKETVIQLKKLTDTFPANVLPPIPVDTKAREASAYGQTLWEYCQSCPALVGSRNGMGAHIGGYKQVVDRLCKLWGLR
jgi:chromosome partitioning protein